MMRVRGLAQLARSRGQWVYSSLGSGESAPLLLEHSSYFRNPLQSSREESPNLVVEKRHERPPAAALVTMNAFELISTSQGLNLDSLFDRQMGLVKRETRFTSKCPASGIMSKIETAAEPMWFDVKKNNYKMKLYGEKSGRKVHFSISTEIFEVAPSLHMVELRKAGGDTLEFHKLYKNHSIGLNDIVWTTGGEVQQEGTSRSAHPRPYP